MSETALLTAPEDGKKEKEGEVEEDVGSMAIVTPVACYITHSIGGSCFYLPYAFSIAGIFAFILILGTIAFTTTCSLIYMREMFQKESNYFNSIESRLPWIFERLKIIRILCIIDVIICTSFYYSCLPMIVKSSFIPENAEPSTNIIIDVSCFIFTAVVPLIIDKKWKCDEGHPRNNGAVHIGTQNNIHYSYIKKLEATAPTDLQHSRERNTIKMESVLKEMSNLDSKRMILLSTFTLMTMAQIIFCSYLDKNKVIENLPLGQEPGSFGYKISVASSVVVFLFMNYAILLPFCPGEYGLPKHKYIQMAVTGKSGLALFYAVFGLSVYFSFTGQATSFYLDAYGNSPPGKILALLDSVLTITAIVLRVVPCCKLIQVLIFDSECETFFNIIFLLVTFFSTLLSHFVSDTLYLVLFAGSVTSNLLLIIFPSLAYLVFKWKKRRQEKLGIKFAVAVLNLLLHTCLMISIVNTLQKDVPTTGQGIRHQVEGHWSGARRFANRTNVEL